MKITKDTKASIPKNALVKMTQMNHITHIQYMEKRNDRVNIKKLDKDRYVHLATGEIKEFNHIETRKDSYNSLKQTFGKVSDLINNNFKGQPNEFHVTLTYKDNVTDTKRLYSDFKRFMTRLKRKYQDKSTIDYMSVVEPQERGAWHCHVLLRFNDVPKLFVSNNLIRELWGQGKIVSTKSLKNIDNIGVYLTAYLSDVELNENTAKTVVSEQRDVIEKEVNGEKKRFIKGGRLHMYPPGMNLYRKSKGIVFPESEMMTYENAKKIVGSAQPHYSAGYHVEDDSFTNTIIHEQYNSRR